MRVCQSKYILHTSDIPIHMIDIQMTYEWQINDIQVHMNDIRITLEYIQMAGKLHMSDMRNAMCLHNEWHTSRYGSHTSDTHKGYSRDIGVMYN